MGYFIDRWLAGGEICWWDTGRVYYWVEYVIGIMGGGAICDLQWKQVGKGDNSDLYLLCNFAKIFMDN